VRQVSPLQELHGDARLTKHKKQKWYY